MKHSDSEKRAYSFEIRGVPIRFPYDPYPIQKDYMEKVIEALDSGVYALLQSPTGTGKTMCLLSATLAWIEKESKRLGPDKKSPILIVYASRTHSQLIQVMKELKASEYHPKALILGSRDTSCIKMGFENKSGSSLSAACAFARKTTNNDYKCQEFKNLNKFGDQIFNDHSAHLYDIEELKVVGRRENFCPYYYTSTNLNNIDLLLLPYNYLLNYCTMSLMDFDLDNSILIFDEAHNIERTAEEGCSFQISTDDLRNALQEAETLASSIFKEGLGKDDFPPEENWPKFVRFVRTGYLIDPSKPDLKNPSATNKEQRKKTVSQDIIPFTKMNYEKFAIIDNIDKESVNSRSKRRNPEKSTRRTESLNDDFEKFGIGFTMLSKMGYKIGMGLGKLEDGNLESVKAVKKISFGEDYLGEIDNNELTADDIFNLHETLKNWLNGIEELVFKNQNLKKKRGIRLKGKKIWKILKSFTIKGEQISKKRCSYLEDGLSPTNLHNLMNDLKKITAKNLNFPGMENWCNFIRALGSLNKAGISESNNKLSNSLEHYRIFIKVDPSGGKNINLNLWCLSPSLIFKKLTQKFAIRNIILTSGTLTPLEAIEKELKLEFPIKLINKHIIDCKKNLLSAVVRKGVNETMNFAYKNYSGNKKLLIDLGNTIIKFIGHIPNGVLVFFPSSGLLEECYSVWCTSDNIVKRMEEIKEIVKERENMCDYKSRMTSYVKHAKTEKGAILLAIHRGKMSEGVDFTDELARGVIIVGIPNLPIKDPKVIFKKEYLDILRKNSNIGDNSTLSSNDWYVVQAIRAVNQAAGRVIRHKKDYGVVLLMDERYDWHDTKPKLSEWIKDNLQTFDTIDHGISKVIEFFKNIKNPIEKDAESVNHPRVPSPVLKRKFMDEEHSKNEKISQKVFKDQITGNLSKESPDLTIFQFSPTTKPKGNIVQNEVEDSLSSPKEYCLFVGTSLKGNPGTGAGAGAFIIKDKNSVTIEKGGVYLHNCTCNEAPYHGLIEGLKKCIEMKISLNLIKSDSDLLINQLKGVWSANKNLAVLLNNAKNLMKKMNVKNLNFVHIEKKENKEASVQADEYLITRNKK